MNLTIHEWQEANKKRNEANFPTCQNWQRRDWCLALAGEVGELCNLVKKMNRCDIGISSLSLQKEIADIVTYATLLANYEGISLETALIKKFNEVSKRVGSTITLP